MNPHDRLVITGICRFMLPDGSVDDQYLCVIFKPAGCYFVASFYPLGRVC
jgi:hypothetical protein